jgi:hypothetical protein
MVFSQCKKTIKGRPCWAQEIISSRQPIFTDFTEKFTRLFVTLASPKLLALGKEKRKMLFLLLFARLFVTLDKLLHLGRTK